MTLLEEMLQKLDNVLVKYNLPNYKKLYDPLATSEIDVYMQELGIINEDLRKLFTWKNGYDPNQNVNILCQIFEIGTLLTLGFIQKKININQTSIHLWNNAFVPIITDSTGQFILFNNQKGEDYGKLFLYSASLLFVKPVSCYDSILAMIKTTIEAYEQGALFYDVKEDWVNSDMRKYYQIASKNNRGSKLWDL